MNTTIVLAVLGVLVAWGLVAMIIWRWGPGRIRRSVRCPRNLVRARVEVLQTEGEFGSLRKSDILACSLFPLREISCGKECLSRRLA